MKMQSFIFCYWKRITSFLMSAAFLVVFLSLQPGAMQTVQAQTRGWGWNTSGQLGIGNIEDQPTPVIVSAVPDATGMSVGYRHTLFLKPNGTLLASGYNGDGELGDGNATTTPRTSPVAVLNLTNVVQATAGYYHSAALLADGTVWSWGANNQGQLGNGTTTTTGCQCIPTPTQSSISGVIQIDAGSGYTLALKSDGTVWAWGWNAYAQLGNNSSEIIRPSPMQVGFGVPGFNNIISVSAGVYHSMALKADGTVWIWGNNEVGQVGNGSTMPNHQLIPVQNTTLSNIVQISAGEGHSFALRKDGTVWVWGSNYYGPVGNGIQSGIQPPVQTPGISNVIEIETVVDTNIVRLKDGTVRSWGYNFYGDVGNGTTTETGCNCQPSPVQALVGAGNTGIAMGSHHGFALKPVISASGGTNQTFRGDNLRLTFANVTGTGNVSYTAIDPSAVAGSYAVPTGYTIENLQPAYDVTTTAATSGSIDVCIAGINEFNETSFNKLKILHGEGANWVDRTTTSNFMRREICARVMNLSPFVVASSSDDDTWIIRRPAFDFDGDGRADISVFRPANGVWYLNRSTQGFSATQFGLSTDLITPADFDGDGKTDIAVFRNGNWFWINSSNGSFNAYQFGTAFDIPVPADFSGDGRAELAVYREGTSGKWYLYDLANNQFSAVQFGTYSDQPVPADYDGDGKADFAVFRRDFLQQGSSGVWYLLQSTQGFAAVQFGIATDSPVIGDYDGDGKADQAVYRKGVWYLLRSKDGFKAIQFGVALDAPVPADYDGDGKTDIAVFRNGTWYLQQTTNGFAAVSFGVITDRPIPAAYSNFAIAMP